MPPTDDTSKLVERLRALAGHPVMWRKEYEALKQAADALEKAESERDTLARELADVAFKSGEIKAERAALAKRLKAIETAAVAFLEFGQMCDCEDEDHEGCEWWPLAMALNAALDDDAAAGGGT